MGSGQREPLVETDTVAAGAAANAHLALPGQGKVKFFGRELPPKCALRDCWLTDDGHTYYCTDFTCNRHKYRRTKHDRYSRHAHLDPARVQGPRAELPLAQPRGAAGEEGHVWPLLPFRCPRCASADLQMRLLQNRYECMGCAFQWR